MGTGNTTLDGAPAVEAGAGKPQISHPQAGNTQTAPPCVETDGPPSKGEGLHIPDSRTRLSEAEIDALEYVVEEGRIACMDDYGILRSLLVRVRPEWEAVAKSDTDSQQPFAAAYAVYVNGEYDSSYGPDAIDEALEIATDCNGEVVPLYRTPQANATPGECSVLGSYEKSDEKRTNTNTNRVEDEIAIEAAWERTGLKPAWPDDEAGCGVKYANAMAQEIERLRFSIRRLADQDATLSVQGGNVTVTMDDTLTDEERAALHWFAHYGLPEHRAATLRSLLERLHT
jgi:hypothetical protein